MKFTSPTVEDVKEHNEIWKAYLTPTLLSVRISTRKAKKLVWVVWLSVKLGCKAICPMSTSTELSHAIQKQLLHPQDEQTWRVRLHQVTQNPPTFTPIALDTSFACTNDFFMWR